MLLVDLHKTNSATWQITHNSWKRQIFKKYPKQNYIQKKNLLLKFWLIHNFFLVKRKKKKNLYI